MSRFNVEPLPQRPSLEFQQKRAKRLLRDVWAAEPEAVARVQALHPAPGRIEKLTLHDAQLVVARGYGFASWAALKRKIESLTKTPLELFDLAVRSGDAELARELLSQHAELRAGINQPRFDFASPAIHQAKHHVALVDVLLEFGADINARSTWWAGSFGILEHALSQEQAQPLIERGATITPWAAAIFGMREALEQHLDANPGLVEARGGDGKSLLHFASTLEIVDLLLDRGAATTALDVDHQASALQYLIENEAIARRLIERGSRYDIFAAARLGDAVLVQQCLGIDPTAADARIGKPPYTGPGLHIYCWTLGFDLSPLDVARKFGHPSVVDLLLAHATPKARLLDAAWNGDAHRARAELAAHPGLMTTLTATDHALLAAAAWWYRPAAVHLMLELGFDSHARGAHQSTPLDRASFHGYTDIVTVLLACPNPPLALRNEFGGMPLDAAIHGSMHGWDTGHPRDHAGTVQALLAAGATLDVTEIPTGNDPLDAVLRAWLEAHPLAGDAQVQP